MVVPDIEPSQGKGKPRVFSGRNLLQFGMIEVMVRMETPLSTIKNIMDVLRKGEWVPEDIKDGYTEEEYKKWQDDNTLKIISFWGGDNWGVNMELVYIESRNLTIRTGTPYSNSRWVVLHEIKYPSTLETGGLGTLVNRFDTGKLLQWAGAIETVVFLGTIKNKAMRLVFAGE